MKDLNITATPAKFATLIFIILTSLQVLRAQAVRNPDAPGDTSSPASTPSVVTSGTTALSPRDVDEEIVMMTPFEVSTARDRGYHAENTLAGSRMSTNLSDLAASITVITEQQMEDTASLDLNDIFRYEANTEGSETYTPTGGAFLSRGTLMDGIAGYSAGSTGDFADNGSANRIRGVGSADSAINYFPSSPRIPMDRYNLQSVEISRGPNSMLFGMGNPAGIVNQSTAKAHLNKNSTRLRFRVDNLGSMRGELTFNRVILKNKLAIYGALLYDNKEFERKPSYDRTNRQYGALTFRPFRKTVIRANVEGYNNHSRRPNSITPRDFVTPWRQAGRPVYDPIARTVTNLDTGAVMGPYLANINSPGVEELYTSLINAINANPGRYSMDRLNVVRNASTGAISTLQYDFDNDGFTNADNVASNNNNAFAHLNSPLYVRGLYMNNGYYIRPIMMVDNGNLAGWYKFQPTAVGGNGNTQPSDANQNPWKWAMYDRKWTRSDYLQDTVLDAHKIPYAGYIEPGVTDKSIYDYTSINALASNYGKVRATNYNVELEQEIFRNLFFNAGWFRQDIDTDENYSIGQTDGATLYVDTNLNRTDGTPNPYFGLPFIEDKAPDNFRNSETRDSFRASLAFTPDFTRNKGWTKWLGRHQILGMWAKDRVESQRVRYRTVYTSVASNSVIPYIIPTDTTTPGWNYASESRPVQRWYYLASPGDPQGTVTHSTGKWPAPHNGGLSSGYITAFNFDTRQWQQDYVEYSDVFYENPTNLNNTNGKKIRDVESFSFGITSHWLDSRIVSTLGWRRDAYKGRRSGAAAFTDFDGNEIMPSLTASEMFTDGYANEDLIMNRWDPTWEKITRDTKTAGVVVRPLKGIASLEKRAAQGSLWAEFLVNLGLTYNYSDNFNAPPEVKKDAFHRRLPDPVGVGQDWGVQFVLFKNKLVGRISWFDMTNENERTGAAATLMNRLVAFDTKIFYEWAQLATRIEDGQTVWTSAYDPANPPPLTEAQTNTVWEKMGLPRNYYASGQIGATQTNKAKGAELQLTYNPTSNWSIKLTASKMNSVYDDIAPEYDAWVAERMPVWQNASFNVTDYYQGAPTIMGPYGEQIPALYIGDKGGLVYMDNFMKSFGYDSAVQLTNTNGNTSANAYFTNVVLSQVSLAKALQGMPTPNQRKYRANIVTNYNISRGALKGLAFGGAERYESKAIVGFYGKALDPTLDPSTPGYINAGDVTRPIYDKAQFYTDLWISYNMRMFSRKVGVKFQLNVSNVFENGSLRVIAVNYDGSPYGYRIIDPRRFIFTATFNF